MSLSAAGPPRRLLVAADDPLVHRGLDRLSAELDVEVVVVGPEGPEGLGERAGTPVAVVLDADQDGEAIAAWRARFPASLLVGFLAVPLRSRWTAAERAGCDLVVNRGAVAQQVRRRLLAAPQRRHPLADSADVAGRLGLLGRIEGTPVGAIALFRVGSSLVAVDDRCPHGGAPLSGGFLDGSILICPGHGSQFDLTSGERLRGPADAGIRRYRVVEESGRIWLAV